MSVKIFDIRCVKCGQGVFKGEPNKEVCTYCGIAITEDLILADMEKRSQELKTKIEDLKVYEFESGGESDWVIAMNQEDARNYYATVIDDIEEYDITELENWHEHVVRVETDEMQSDGTYWQDQTMLQLAKENYINGYDQPEIIASTCY